MGSRARRSQKKKRKNRGGERLKEWRVLKEFNLVPGSTPKVTVATENISTLCETSNNEVSNGAFQDLVCDKSRPTGDITNRDNVVVLGRRIVDIIYFIEQLKLLSSHAPQFDCTLRNMILNREVKQGLRSGFVLQCEMCGITETVWSEPKKDNEMDVNSAAVAGTMCSGGNFSSLTKLIGAMNIRCMNHKTFEKYQNKVSKGWEESALQEMKLAAEEEARFARERGDVDRDGVPLLTVVADGSWAKRSYRTNYNSLSGVVAIVGYHTRKVLYFGVKNKYCVICTRSANKGLQKMIPQHTCFKNWHGSSSAMEPMAIVEGFLLSEEMYGVRYSKLIADGDSSVYTKILEYRPYDTVTVEKVECRNHLLRNYCNKLRDIATTTYKSDDKDIDRGLHVKLRRVLGSRIMRCRTAVRKAVMHRKRESGTLQLKAEKLRKDLINGPSHIFGEHSRCKEIGYFCTKENNKDDKNHVEDMKQCGIYQSIMRAVNGLADYSTHLIQDVDSNIVEHYNSTIAMFTGGKRTNLIQRNSYQTRCAAAVVKYNTGRPFYKLHKSLTKSSPGNYSKLYEIRAKRKAEYEVERKKKVPKAMRSLYVNTRISGPDKDYGPHCQKADLETSVFDKKVEQHMEGLKKTREEVLALETLTVNQRDCKEWLEERRIRLTASNFGLICRRKPESSCGPVVTQLLYSKVDCAATRYGQAREEEAIRDFEKFTGSSVKKCGLFVDLQHPWLAASPDGLIGDESVLEIKCPFTGKDKSPDELIRGKKGLVGSFWHHNKTDDSFDIKKQHNYYYQVQGQLQITKRLFCYFSVWTPHGIKIEKIKRDDDFWLNNMLPKLEKFYFNCLLPEIIDPRRRRNMPIREPSYILEAQSKKLEKKKLN